MSWSQDVVILVLFPYLVPSVPIYKNELWSKDDIRIVLEHLLLFYSSIPMEKIQKLLEAFVTRVLSISSRYNMNLDHDLSFLADIENRCSFTKIKQWRSSIYSLYACSFLIEHKFDIHEDDECALVRASENGHKGTVALLLEHKADIHTFNDQALQWATDEGHKDTAALLLEYKADVHAQYTALQ
jgi:ankyrin repeat protein